MNVKTESATEIENANQTRRTAEEDAKDGPIAKEGAGRRDATTEHKNAGINSNTVKVFGKVRSFARLSMCPETPLQTR
jgi:hypothetical protein